MVTAFICETDVNVVNIFKNKISELKERGKSHQISSLNGRGLTNTHHHHEQLLEGLSPESNDLSASIKIFFRQPDIFSRIFPAFHFFVDCNSTFSS
jgi:hypothetical protein